ncbi:hypothetical protein MATR_30150 [Marivirga tractuosa]|uniref:Helix-turn-helix domain protein n=1 Tax=Marivirga tractuosa (strain ATCC 23168 / DSM 4126 / NBRC 15989 / NCIMB 1408 / VKM B-1430 / H-43) TaxID=643867 RepID=E4TV71_MARTH|nr:helix-turn-helix transcriptional regulator [Marivirga tractuosa]ADR23136.1 helix-turn-helix domain protein [Marivirga tractuosa DSM 4126]BDD16190.1 hypothetical protein MATR_30150 [Marivirga tractuosa]
MDQNKLIGLNLKRYRESLGLSQVQLADYLSINREEISYYENGKRTMPVKLIEKAAKLFGIDEFDLYESDPEHNDAKVALAFRADSLGKEDLEQIADFRKIVLNYLAMKKAAVNEPAYS